MSASQEDKFGANTPGFPGRFEVQEQIRFHHCDPAGIAFFARIDELLNATFEDWCAAIGIPFAECIARDRRGFPLVHASIDYTGILRMGDVVTIGHHLRTLGRTSFTFDISIHANGRECLKGTHVRVMTSLDTHGPVAIPETLRSLFVEHAS